MASYKLLTSKNHRLSHDGCTLFRVQYADGTLGGWIENERNLDQMGRCRVLNEAKVYGTSRVSDNAMVSDNAIVKDSAVSDNASVSGDATVVNKSRVWYNACVCNNAYLNRVSLVENEIVLDNGVSVFAELVA
jgi:carbonic anhydrase/acetyltransferase-like protein (isoleucine patch superfamily)